MPDPTDDDMVTIDSLAGDTARSWGASLLMLEPGEEGRMVVRKENGDEVVFTVRREVSA